MNAGLDRFRALVQERIGLAFDAARIDTLAETLRRRVEASGGACGAYLEQLAAERYPGEELRRLAQELTVTETYFFRAAEQIRAFLELALPRNPAAAQGTRKLRVLSAGCASGEEPYSLAMAVREAAPWAADSVSILALDINPAMLAKARRACYSEWSLRQLDGQQRARWFHAEGALFRLDDAARRAVAFEERNLAEENADLWQPGSWDVVFCRNMLMYLDPATARRAIARVAGALTPGGYLFLGHAETLRGLSDDFQLRHTHGTFYYQLKDGGARPPQAREDEAAPAVAPPEIDGAWVEAIGRAAERIDALAGAAREPAGMAIERPAEAPDLAPVLELLRRERYGQALAELDALPAAQARRADVLLLRAVSAVHSGALQRAEGACRELLERDELNAGAHYVLALCRESAGDASGAAEEHGTTLDLDPGFAMARLHLGLLARRRGEPGAARRELSLALSALRGEDASRLLLFGGGFSREALVALCRAELAKCGGA